MDGVLQIAALLAVLGGPADRLPVSHLPTDRATESATVVSRDAYARAPAAASPGIAVPERAPETSGVAPAVRGYQAAADAWTSEDKFRHAAASWAAMVFTYAAARAIEEDTDAALTIALPVTASFGIAKEIVDRRNGGPFSFRDLTADAIGAAVAWIFLREVR